MIIFKREDDWLAVAVTGHGIHLAMQWVPWCRDGACAFDARVQHVSTWSESNRQRQG